MIQEHWITKELVTRFEESQEIAKEIRRKMNETDMTYAEIWRKCLTLFNKKYSDVFIGKIIKWEWKWNGLNLYHLALSVWFTKKEYLTFVSKARKNSIQEDINIMDEFNFDVLKDADLEEVLLSKNWIISEEAQKDLKSYIAFLRTKYPKK